MMENDRLEILSMQEAERKRIAEDLHDTTVQDLVHLSQQLELAILYLDKDTIQTKKELFEARNNIKKIIEDMRETIYDLRPMAFDDIGWESAIENLKNNLEENNDINVIFNICNIDNYDSLIKITIYRIIREACQNILKHANASKMVVNMKENTNSISLMIMDDGIGIGEYDRMNHFGLSMVKEKVGLLSGRLSIFTNENGTTLDITIPI
ncbi:MAG: histidine kinase [Lachnospiraceae bacterium]|nr:histidine kinase [Lachnospiraceae bacterium]